MNQLAYKNIKCIILLGCDTGNSELGASSIAAAFATRISGVVISGDGIDGLDYDDDSQHYTYTAWSKTDSDGHKGWGIYQYHPDMNPPSITCDWSVDYYASIDPSFDAITLTVIEMIEFAEDRVV